MDKNALLTDFIEAWGYGRDIEANKVFRAALEELLSSVGRDEPAPALPDLEGNRNPEGFRKILL